MREAGTYPSWDDEYEEIIRDGQRKARWDRRRLRKRSKEVRTQWVHRVQLSAMEIPEWAERWALPGFSRGPSLIWVKQRNVARKLKELDLGCGGVPLVEQFEGRRCCLCKRWMIGLDAQAQMRREQAARIAGVEIEPCGESCTKGASQWQQRTG